MRQKDLLFLSASTLFLVIAWIIFNLIHNSASSTISETTSKAINPISPSFDTQTIANLKKRAAITPLYAVGVLPPKEEPTPTSQPTFTPTPTEIEEPTPTEEETIEDTSNDDSDTIDNDNLDE